MVFETWVSRHRSRRKAKKENLLRWVINVRVHSAVTLYARKDFYDNIFLFDWLHIVAAGVF